MSNHFHLRETMHARARRIMAEELAIDGLSYEHLATLPKGAAVKFSIARRLRQESTLTLKDVAALLHAGNWRSLANALSLSVSK